MAETVTLPAPVVKPSQTLWRIDRVTIDVTAKSFYVQLLGDNGETTSAVYPTPAPPDHPSQPTGQALLSTINKANLSGANPSFVKRILDRLITDGYIAGTVTGTPE